MYDLPVYLLDLCIFSYHLHSQTMIWPMDPYYEQMREAGAKPLDKTKRRRKCFMPTVHGHQWLPQGQQPGASTYHGPSSCMNWPNMDNQHLDPIVSRYDRLYPWRPSFTRPTRHEESWLIYNTPVEITDPINQVYMVRYGTGGASPWPYKTSGQAQPTIVVDQICSARPALAALRQPTYQAPPATDLLYCFEGGTGGTETEPPLWSMMGYVLARVEMINNLPVYDVFIVFRGSRSGKVRKTQSWKGKGNPDWATDLALRQFVEKDSVLSRTGSVVQGFRSSLKTILPTLVRSLAEIQQVRNASPRHIYVTGHSLGGALSAQFASAMLVGTAYGPNGTGPAMPQTVRAWPWDTMRLVTFSSPSVGGETFHHLLNQALPSLRIWLEGDPITQERWHYPVGAPYRIPRSVVGTLASHDPYHVRRKLIQDRGINGFDITTVPAVPAQGGADPPDTPWVFKNTFSDLLSYFAQPGNRKNIVPLSQCLGGWEPSSFASEFIIFLEIWDQQKTWAAPLVTWIKTIKQAPRPSAGWIGANPSITQPLPAFPVAGLSNLPRDLADLKTYLVVCLVLCALSKGRSLTDVQTLFSTQEWANIQNFR